jgi:sarcosine oxidase subunit beta
VQLAVISFRMFEHWADLVREATLFHKTGFVRIVHPKEAEQLKRNVEMQQGLGVNVKLISQAELHDLAPDWVVDEVGLAAYEPDSGYGDGAGVANDFLNRAREMGVAYSPRTRVTAFKTEAGRACGVQTDQGDVAARIVVAASGPWTRPLFHAAGYDLPIETEYHQVAILKNPDFRGEDVPALIPLLPLISGRMDAINFWWATFMESGQSTLMTSRSALPTNRWKN